MKKIGVVIEWILDMTFVSCSFVRSFVVKLVRCASCDVQNGRFPFVFGNTFLHNRSTRVLSIHLRSIRALGHGLSVVDANYMGFCQT